MFTPQTIQQMEKKNNHVAAINCNNSLANAIISATTKADCCSNAAATTVAPKLERTIRFLRNLYRDMYETNEPDSDVQVIDAHMAFVRQGTPKDFFNQEFIAHVEPLHDEPYDFVVSHEGLLRKYFQL